MTCQSVTFREQKPLAFSLHLILLIVLFFNSQLLSMFLHTTVKGGTYNRHAKTLE